VAIELVETTIERVEVVVRAEVPFADDAGFVASGAKGLGERGLLDREAGVRVGGLPGGVSLEAETLRVATGDEAGSAGGAGGEGDVGAAEDRAAGGETINVGRGDVLLPWKPVSA
jgi:hypothetical protein